MIIKYVMTFLPQKQFVLPFKNLFIINIFELQKTWKTQKRQ